MTKILKDISSECNLNQDGLLNLNDVSVIPCVEKAAIKKFNIVLINESEDELRKSILRQIKDFKFERSFSTWNKFTFCYHGYKLPVESNPLKQMAIIIRMDPGSYILGKCEPELWFYVLNNEVFLKHNQNGPLIEIAKSGDKVNIPNGKKFFLCNQGVDTTHLLLLMQPMARIPDFLI